MRIRLSISKKLFISHFLLVCLLLAGVGTYFYSSASENLLTNLKTRLKNTAALVSEILEVHRLDTIRSPEDMALPAYQDYLRLLRAIRHTNPDVSNIYIMRLDGEKVYFVIDSDESERQALPGREYTTEVPSLREGFSKPSVDSEIVTDEWGSFLSGYAPIKHGEGRYLVGIDMNAEEVKKKSEKLRLSAMISLALCVGLALLLSRLVASHLTRPIKVLIARCESIAEGALDESVLFRSGDELDHLIEAINTMSESLSESRKQYNLAQEALQASRNDLEMRVLERTRELQETNERLNREIEARNQVETALRSSEKRYRELADLLPQPVFEADSEGRLTFLNRSFYENFGYRESDLKGELYLRDLMLREEDSTMKSMNAADAASKGESIERMARRRDGTVFPALFYFSRIFDHGISHGLRGIIIDLSDLRRMQEELFKAKKLESIGVLAGGLAHDFNNLLAVILGNISLAQYRNMKSSQIEKLLKNAEKASLQAKNLARQLITLASGGAPVKTAFSIRDTLQDAIDLSLSGSNVRYQLNLEDELWLVHGDSGQIHQALVNLIINAREAMPEGGTIKIEADNRVVSSKEISSLRPGQYVRIVMEDEGSGIEEDLLPKIFDPYFSTKQRGVERGTGLGLTIVYSIIKRHNGHIEVSSQPGEGTRVVVHLPASERTIQDEKAYLVEHPISVRHGRILCMDDDEMLRDILRDMLIHLGYEVETAAEGAEAIRLYREAMEKGIPFDLALLDLTVRDGMGGKETVQALMQLNPSLKAVVITGYSEDPIMSEFAEYGFRAAIPKPFHLEQLGKILHALINEND